MRSVVAASAEAPWDTTASTASTAQLLVFPLLMSPARFAQALQTHAACGVAAGVLLLTAPAALAAPHVAIAPAAGPAGTQVAVNGGGYPRRAVVVIAAGSAPPVRVRADRHGSFRGHVAIGSAAGGRVAIVSLGRGARVVNRFRVQPSATATGEAAGARGARGRWSADPASLHLTGAGFGARAAVKVRAAGTTRTMRAGRRGRFAVSLPASSAGRALVTSRGTRLRFAFAALGQPRLPIRAAFYYPWFPEAWRQRGIDPFTHFPPAAGFYSEDDAAVIRHQVGD